MIRHGIAVLSAVLLIMQPLQARYAWLLPSHDSSIMGMYPRMTVYRNGPEGWLYNPATLAADVIPGKLRIRTAYAFENLVPDIPSIKYHSSRNRIIIPDTDGDGHLALGINYSHVGYGTLEFIEPGGEALSSYRSHEEWIQCLAARQLAPDILGGAAIKYQYSNLFPGNAISPEMKGSAVAIDLGLLYGIPIHPAEKPWFAYMLNTGLAVRNLGTQIHGSSGFNIESVPQIAAAADFEFRYLEFIRLSAGAGACISYFPASDTREDNFAAGVDILVLSSFYLGYELAERSFVNYGVNLDVQTIRKILYRFSSGDQNIRSVEAAALDHTGYAIAGSITLNNLRLAADQKIATAGGITGDPRQYKIELEFGYADPE